MRADIQNFEFTLREKKEFFSAFSSLYESGMPVAGIFKSMMHSVKNEKIRTVCAYIANAAERGASIEEAAAPCKTAIGIAYTALLTAGEKSGKLEDILENICANISKQEKIRAGLIDALVYPVSMIMLIFAVFLLFQFFILPCFKSITGERVEPVSLLISAVVKILIIFAVLAAIAFYAVKTPAVMKRIRNFLFSLKGLKGILENYYYSNFFYIMSLSYSAGIPAAEGVFLASSIIGIEKTKYALKKASKLIENGSSVHEALRDTNIFSDFAISQTAAGEESGKLDKMFKIAAKDYENKMDEAVKLMLKLLGPAVIIFAGILTCILAVKMYSEYFKAIFSMV